MDDLITFRELLYVIAAFVGGMLVGSNNPTWLSGKWKEIQKKAEEAKEVDELADLAKKVSDILKRGN